MSYYKGQQLYPQHLTTFNKPVFGTYGLLFCMKTVAKLIRGVRVRVIVS